MMSTGTPLVTSGMSDAYTLAITHIELRSATVNAGVVPAVSSCPGLMSFSTTVPGIGATIVPWTGGVRWPSRIAFTVASSRPSARSASIAASRSASAPAASERAWSSSLRASASFAKSCSSSFRILALLRTAVSALRYVATSAAKSGDATVASGCPAVTVAPSVVTMRDTGPETGESTCVDLSPLNATVPVTSSSGAKLSLASVTIFSVARCASVTLNDAGFSAAAATAASGLAPHPAANAISVMHALAGSVARARACLLTGNSGGERGERHAGGALEIRPRRVGGGECIGQLALGGEAGGAGGDHLDGGQAAKGVAAGGHAVRLARRREQLVANEDDLPQ